MTVHWEAGESPIRARLDSFLVEPERHPDAIHTMFERPGRRRLSKLSVEEETFFVKQTCSGPRSMRNALGRWTRLETPDREWRALDRLNRTGVAVPEPVGLATLPNGDRALVTRFVDGVTLKDYRPVDRAERIATLVAVGGLVRRLHDAGFVHRDLHWGNVLITARGPVLLDLQAAWPSRLRIARLRDIGDLDYSLSPRLSIADRMRLRSAALGHDPHERFDLATRETLRSIGRRSVAQGRAHSASRTRRTLQTGRLYESLRCGSERGMRLRSVALHEVEAVLGARSSEDASRRVLKSDARARVSAVQTPTVQWILKEFRSRGVLRRVADIFRGSPGRRAWLGGHGLLARGIGAATPIAFVERRRFGVPVSSAVVLEHLGDQPAADACDPEWAEAPEIMRAIERVATGLHRRGAVHSDLKASHVLLERCSKGVVGRLIDLEGVRFPSRRLSDRVRVQALAELNASLPDHIPDVLRLDAFRRYAAALPFNGAPERRLREIVAISVARGHHWSGRNCALATTQRETRTQRK